MSCKAPASDPGAIEVLLDEGRYDEADSAIAARVAADPNDHEAWFLRARLLLARGHHVEAREACVRAAELWPDILPVYRLISELAETAVMERDGAAGMMRDKARRMLLAHQPDDAVLANRIAGELCAAGRLGEALPYLRSAAPVLGHQDSALWNYSTTLALTGGYHELLGIEPMLARFARDVPPPFGPFAHLAGAKLALGFDRQAVHSDIVAAHGGGHWLDAMQLGDRLQDAIAQQRPLSVILLSEAHARLVTYASLRAHLVLNEAEMSAVVNSVWMDAFGDTIETYGAAVAGALGRKLLTAIAEADVVALADAEHLAAAHEHFGFLAETQRIVLQQKERLYAGLGVIGALHDAMPFLRPLLADQPFVGFVGCYPDLAERLARFSQIAGTATYLVPAALNQAGVPDSLRGRGHFPDLFEQTLATLTVPFPGAVFLVAAGLLGCVYCGRIRQLGGIAIDIDTIATRWMNP